MSSFLMSYPHVQGAMSTSHGYEPKFPPSESDFHHLHHHHSGYGAMNGITATTNHMDYNYHNGYNYNYATPSPSTPFYHHHHHPPYGSPQMHHPTNTPSPNISQTPQTQTQNSYATNVVHVTNNNNNAANIGNRNNSSITTPGNNSNTGVGGLVNALNVASENTTSNVDNMGYYNSYYSNTNGHLTHDLPLQCPSTEPPANTALGLQELGKLSVLCIVSKIIESDTQNMVKQVLLSS